MNEGVETQSGNYAKNCFQMQIRLQKTNFFPEKIII